MAKKRKAKKPAWRKLAKRLKRVFSGSAKKEVAKPHPSQWFRLERNQSWYDDDGDYIDAE